MKKALVTQDLTAKGKLTSIKEGTKPEIPVEVQQAVGK